MNNDIFAENSWYFRNALVRANYNNLQKGIHENSEFLEKFFRNLLLGEHNELKNRYCHIRYTEQVAINSEKSSGKVAGKSGGQKTDLGGQKKWSETTQKVYDLIKENPSISRKELSDTLSINPSAIQKHIEKLKKEGAISRKNGAKGGHWEVL